MNKSIILLILTAILLAACEKSPEKNISDIPGCIQFLIDNPNTTEPLKTVQAQEIEGEYHYWLNTGFNAFDGAEYIVNEKCENVCTLCGECFQPVCAEAYKTEAWEIIWEK